MLLSREVIHFASSNISQNIKWINTTLTTGIENAVILYPMAVKIDLAPLPPFALLSEPSSLGQVWKNWIKRFQTYITAMNITDDKQ